MFNFQRSARMKGDKARKATQFVKQIAEYINKNLNSFTRILSKALYLVFVAALVAGLALGVTPVPVAYAATITVNTTDDELNSDGDCSLREAIQAANTDAAVDTCLAGSGTDTITLPAGTYMLNIPGENENANATGDLDIKDELTINGAGATEAIIDGNTLDRVFEITGAFPVTISAVTIRNGSVTTITQPDGGGGGISNYSSLLTLVNSSVVNNTADGSGGGISNRGTLELIGSTVSGNSTIYGNGGGIYSYVATVTLTNSTVSGNVSSSGAGGGIISIGTLTVTNSTISHNIAVFQAGGLFNSSGTVAIKNSIVANNTATFGGDCGGGGITSNGHNLSSDDSCGFTGPGDLFNTDPLLDPLQDNGGPTWTHALLTGSPAIDAGSGDCPPPATDQRGIARPQGATCDIGAFEVETSQLFNFTGFFQPVDNLPTLNMVKAGQAIPVKFSLNGDQGLDIFAAGYPISQKIECDSTTMLDGIEETVTAGSSSLSYDPSTDTYTYVWKTNKAWANTCRQLVVKLKDDTYHQANFKFK